MVALSALWLPILLSAALVFFAGFIMWMVSPHHKSDWKRVPDEDALREAINAQKIPPGQYHIPHCADPKEYKSEAMMQKVKEGPIGNLILRPTGEMGMAKNLIISFVYNLVISFFVAYVATHALSPDAPYLSVFRVVGAVAILAYSGALIPNANWFGHTWWSVWKEIFDGVIYGLLTAGVFAWLWP